MDRKKIACLTFHDSSNYGSVLQTYALQTAIENMGHEYKVIDYSNKEKRKFDSLILKPKGSSTKSYLIKLASLPFKSKRKKKFVRFSNKYLNVTEKKYKSRNDLRELGNQFDFYTCGSDQVWNLGMIRFDPAYFLNFVKNKENTFSYAASIGISNLSDKERVFFKENLKNINAISVREKTAKLLIKNEANRESQVVLDPSLLLDREEWAEKFGKKVVDEKYILTYVLSYNKELVDFIEKLKTETGLKVIGIKRGSFNKFNEVQNFVPSPEEFVGLINNAEYVVTNSFHGTAFSSNLNKNFFSFVKEKNSGTTSRIYDYLEDVGLESRLMTKCPPNIDLDNINYENFNRIIEKKRVESMGFIKNIILKER